MILCNNSILNIQILCNVQYMGHGIVHILYNYNISLEEKKNCEYVSIISNLTVLLHQSGPHLLQAFVSFHLCHKIKSGLLSIVTDILRRS